MHARTLVAMALVLTAAVSALAPVPPAVVEQWYSTGLYPVIQRALTPISNLIPFAVLDLLVAAGLFLIGRLLVRGVAEYRRTRRRRPLAPMAWRVVVVASVVYLLFLLVWGWNYRRIAMQERLAMDGGTVGSEAVVALGLEAASHLNRLHAPAHEDGWVDEQRSDRRLLEGFSFVQRRLSEASLAAPGRLKHSLFGFYFRWAGIDGMIHPFALEVIANPDLLPWERPFVAAHEWAHLAGYAHEAEANFVGWLTCLRGSAGAQYSGWLFLYWQIAAELSPVGRQRLSEALGAGPRADVEAIADRMRRGQLPFLRTASWRVYDQYLRANRVDEGVRSYGEVVTLILRARFDDGWGPIRRGRPALLP